MINRATPKKIAFVGNYLPEQCGIANFNFGLHSSISAQFPQTECLVVSVKDKERSYDYPEEVRIEIDKEDISSYEKAANFINLSNIDVVFLQHEFGIYGGIAGSHILALIRSLRLPVITTLHTTLKEPSPEQRWVMEQIIKFSSKVVTMVEYGRGILQNVYHVPDDKIEVIPHGIPNMAFADTEIYKDQLGFRGKSIILTYGLLSVNKGIEYVLQALPLVVNDFPDLLYIVLGATHPNIVREYGESYRASLERMAQKLKINKHVLFDNRFVHFAELKKFLAAADIVITPYPDISQIASGTLSYSLGSGKAVISTPYYYAQELLADDRGILVPFGDPEAIAREIVELLRDDSIRSAMSKRAYDYSRRMVWSKVAHLYVDIIRKGSGMSQINSIHRHSPDKKAGKVWILPAINLDHILRMSDTTGILQHARYSIPNFDYGYCTDDNARALLLGVLLEETGFSGEKQLQSLIKTYASFINHAFDSEKRRFRNFMGYNRNWLEEIGSEESQGRSIWALGACIGRSARKPIQMWAFQLFTHSLPLLLEIKSPRAWAFGLFGIHEYSRVYRGDRFANKVRQVLTERITNLYKENSSKEWSWFENNLFYDNAVLPHALILNRNWVMDKEIFETGLTALQWLIELQTSENGRFRPIGNNGWYLRGRERAQFDQQPIEAYATVSACLEAFHGTKDIYWLTAAQTAFDWFLGSNDLDLPLYDPSSGGTYDGLGRYGVNYNQGAESTLAFLLSLAEISSTKMFQGIEEYVEIRNV